jgi:hypothetical protein
LPEEEQEEITTQVQKWKKRKRTMSVERRCH